MKHLEAKGRLRILIYLLKKGRAQVSIIQEETDIPTQTVANALQTLHMLKLTEEQREPPYKRYISLTQKGRMLAEKLMEIEKVLSESKIRSPERQADA